jgi:hypothetical protein
MQHACDIKHDCVTRTVLLLIYSTMLLRPEYLSQNLDRPLPTKDGGTLHHWGGVRLHDQHGQKARAAAVLAAGLQINPGERGCADR